MAPKINHPPPPPLKIPTAEDIAAAPPPPPRHADYQISIYRDKLLSGQEPCTTTDPNGLEAQAKRVMPPEGWGYISGGAGEGATMDANRLAFRGWKLVPRMLRGGGVTEEKNEQKKKKKSLEVELFGERYDTPVILAPVGVQSAYHADAETGTARACASLRVPYTISTASSTSPEEIARAADAHYKDVHDGEGEAEARAPRWFQLYWPASEALTASLLRRARSIGCTVLLVTLDTFAMAWRPRDLDTGFLPFVTGQGNAVGFSDPVFREAFRQGPGMGEEEIEDDILGASQAWLREIFSTSSSSKRWEDIAILKKYWDGPIVLKGICSVEDARRAVASGVQGIVVSNHGGRQLDGAVASLEMLPEIADAVGDKITVLFDSGIRTGVDIIKALALGARGVLVGRPVMYGLGIAGEAGARHVLAGLLADLDQSMNLAGIRSVGELDRSWLRQCRYPGDLKASL